MGASDDFYLQWQVAAYVASVRRDLRANAGAYADMLARGKPTEEVIAIAKGDATANEDRAKNQQRARQLADAAKKVHDLSAAL